MPADVSSTPEPAALPDIPPVSHQGERVLTTELLARAYGASEDQLHDNFRKNEDRFTEGVHFHKLKGEALKAFKRQPENIGLADKFASHLVLWTERGAARHAKILTTDEAWAIFGKLEETYFEGHDLTPIARSAEPNLRTAAADFKALVSLGPLFGYDRNQSALAANRATRKFHGVDLLGDMGVTHLTAPQQAAILTPSDIGKDFGNASGMAVNSLLALHGFQVGKRDAKDRGYWEPTEAGQPFAVWQDTARRHSDGTPVRQLKWASTIVDALRAAIAAHPG